MSDMGYIHVYTGNGKGKTTCAVGLSARALGAGLRVFFAQFIKGHASAEFETLRLTGGRFTHHCFGHGRFIKGEPKAEDISVARDGLKACAEALASGNYDLVVMDEANCAVRCGLFSIGELLEVIDKRGPGCEVVVTGRDATPELLEKADLVSELRELKHYAENGVPARKGIEF